MIPFLKVGQRLFVGHKKFLVFEVTLDGFLVGRDVLWVKWE